MKKMEDTFVKIRTVGISNKIMQNTNIVIKRKEEIERQRRTETYEVEYKTKGVRAR